MTTYGLVFSLLMSMLIAGQPVAGKRILFIAQVPSYSHQIVYRSVALTLNKRGHEIVILTTNPINDTTLTNYTEIDFSYAYPILDKESLAAKFRRMNRIELENEIYQLVTLCTHMVYSNPYMRKLYEPESDQTFDAVIIETVTGPGLYGLAHRFGAPLIGIASVDLHRYDHFLLGHPILPSHPSNWEQYEDTGLDLPFWRRLRNFVEAWLAIYRWTNYAVPLSDEIAKFYLGNHTPYVNDIARNMSLVLVDHQPTISYARPTQPSVIFFNGAHIPKRAPPLPKTVQQFLDNATEGFVYMSLGTNVKYTDLPQHATNAILEAFSVLPYRVLWKYDGQPLPRKYPNIFLTKWAPQQGVLAHPNIKLFVYQGGMQSSEEAIHYAVPIIGIPVMFDQGHRIMKMVSLGVGRSLDIDSITHQSFYEAIQDVVTNERYKEKMRQLSALSKDQPYNSVENAVWWIEHVMRHKGAPQLRYSGVDEPWYKHNDMDVVAFIGLLLFLIALLAILVLLWGLRWLSSQLRAFLSVKGRSLLGPTKKIQ